MSAHIGEDAALYALGALDPHEAAAVERHVADCIACARLLAQAEDDVTAMVAAQPLVEPPAGLADRILATPDAATSATHRQRRVPRVAWLTALAAAIVIALLPSAYVYRENITMHHTMVADADAMARIATSPHRSAAFAGRDAHVMYAPDGSWYVVVIRGAKAPVHVVWPHDGERTMLGTAVPHGDVALLYLPKSHRMDQLALMSGGQVVAQAQLVF